MTSHFIGDVMFCFTYLWCIHVEKTVHCSSQCDSTNEEDQQHNVRECSGEVYDLKTEKQALLIIIVR